MLEHPPQTEPRTDRASRARRSRPRRGALALALALLALAPSGASADPLVLGPFPVGDVFEQPPCLIDPGTCTVADFPVDYGVLRTFSYALTPGDVVTDILIEGVWGGTNAYTAPVEVYLRDALVAECTATDPCITDATGRLPFNGGAGFLLSNLGVDMADFQGDDATLRVLQTGTASEATTDLSGLQITVFVERTCGPEICDGFDNDCDLDIDEDIAPVPTVCGLGECSANVGELVCIDGAEVDTCDPFAGAVADDQCDGLDNDCDGTPDDDYVATVTQCGLGLCTDNTGLLECQSGVPVDTCDPFAGATPDDQCDGLDNDCDGIPDDDYLPTATSCGVGQCSGSAGVLACQGGVPVDTCDPFAGATADNQCDGLDNDCDGTPDDEYIATVTSCGVGECSANQGLLECQAGVPVDTCDPFAGATADTQCDGLDNDCDGTPDDEYIATVTSCGVGECSANQGLLECQAGVPVDTCDPFAGAVADNQCDGLDNDCDGAPDDEYIATVTSCGVGQCSANQGLLECQAGVPVDTCDPFAGATADTQCDGLDNDCDGTPDDEYVATVTTCGVGECSANQGLLECQAGSTVDTCDPLAGALPDDQCDGLDNDCDGTPDDGYVATVTTCGVGACSANQGLLECQAGSTVDTCDPLAGALPDTQCDGLDNDCDGAPDDEYVATVTTCGVGECSANQGLLECQAGSTVDTCDPLAGALPDTQCDGLDNDCDGAPDDEYVATVTTCGVGECSANQGLLECQAGSTVDTCDPLEGALPDDQCDGLDNDCDGAPDDGYVATVTTCGVGECSANQGLLECQAGSTVDTCDPLAGALPDDQCDGLDNDCDGAPDDGYVATVTTCGVGECSANQGLLECQAGSTVDTCDPLAGALPDDQCDGLDNDCDGAPDDEYVATVTTCGVGECSANQGLLECQAGSTVDTCDPLAGALPDTQCDGLDNDCDGAPDDEYVATVTTCGVGECSANQGLLECQAGSTVDTCDPLAGALPDTQCDGLDNDCDGAPDDGYVATVTTCGVGECSANQGLLECQAGSTVDTCDPLAGALPDDQCDGLDNDCDGAPDDGYVATVTTCGVGECSANQGLLECQAGSTVDTCDPLAGALPDDQCDGLDNDCDGAPDDAYVATVTTCGVGECSANQGLLECQAGSTVDTCDPLAGALPDDQCDGLDNDCDGAPDDAYVATVTTCGVGECSANQGLLECQAGSTVDTCDPLAGALPDDQCDGLDNDCDGAPDDAYVATVTTCGVGECSANQGLLECQSGSTVDTCDPLAGALPDDQCDGLDNDCDGAPDDAYVATVTTCGVGECSANQGLLECQAGSTVDTCDPLAGALPDTQCDGLDNDCDGTPDDAYVATVTSCGVGACSGNSGLLECQAGSTIDTCDALAGATDETCDGVDNDCDGTPDDGIADVVTGTDVGECRVGIQSCVGGSFEVTQVGILPAQEACNGLDDDCNGQSDDAIADIVTGSNVGECQTEIQRCLDGSFQVTQSGVLPAEELCNGLDDDCDTEVDDNIPDIVTLTDAGECRAEIQSCIEGEFQITQTGIGPAPEQCNGLDDDCDEEVDEDVADRTIGSDVGACQAEIQSCIEGEFQVTRQAIGPSLEICNGIDDDCDTQVDDEVADLVSGSDAGECQTEIQECIGGSFQITQTGIGPVAEICNGLDDDCNAQPDDGIDPIATGSSIGECEAEIQECIGGSFQITQAGVLPTEESCNSLDDNCNSIVDDVEDIVTGSDVGACRPEIQKCLGGTFQVTQTAIDPIAESCNGIDDDCDGAPDDGVPDLANGSNVGECQEQIQSCIDGSYQVTQMGIGPVSELCNGLDDDCSGNVDNGFGPVTCGVGVCETTVESCLAGVPQDCEPLPGPGEEFCSDGLDDDCDGAVDDGDVCELEGFDSFAGDVELARIDGLDLVLVAAEGGGLRLLQFGAQSPAQLGLLDPSTCKDGFDTIAAAVTAVAAERTSGMSYLAAGRCGFFVADATGDPVSPEFVAAIDTPGFALDAEVLEEELLLFVADVNGGLEIFDVTDPDSPQEIGNVGRTSSSFGGAIDVAVFEGLAYVATTRGLRVVDFDNPGFPQLIGVFDTPTSTGPGQDVEVVAWEDETHAYLSAFQEGVYVLDVTDPTLPELIARIPSRDPGVSPVYESTVAGTRLFLGEDDPVLRIFDVTDPADPIELPPFLARGHVWDIVVEDAVAYLALGEDPFGATPGVQAVYVTRMGLLPEDVGAVPEPSAVYLVAAALGTVLWLRSRGRGERKERRAQR